MITTRDSIYRNLLGQEKSTTNEIQRLEDLIGGGGGGEKGLEGLSIYTTTVNLVDDTVLVDISTINVPVGRTLKIGDLILSTPNGRLYITKVLETQAELQFVTSITSEFDVVITIGVI